MLGPGMAELVLEPGRAELVLEPSKAELVLRSDRLVLEPGRADLVLGPGMAELVLRSDRLVLWPPSLQDIYTRRSIRKARRIIKDSSHPSRRLLSLLPSGRRLRSIRSRTSRLRDSFFPQAIRLMNSQN